MTDVGQEQTLIEHLGELRKRLIRIVLILTAGMILCWSYSETLFEYVRAPIAPFLTSSQGGLVYTGLTDKFMSHLKLSLLGGVILTCPLWLYQLWSFIAPGLYKKERKHAALFIIGGTVLFVSGALFAYYIVFPAAFEYLINFGGTIEKPMITIGEYMSFFFLMMVAFGVCFELPLVLVILAMMGIIDQQFLKTKRSYAIVALSIISAVATPTPDMLSMMVLLVPLWLLYEASIVIIGFIEKS